MSKQLIMSAVCPCNTKDGVQKHMCKVATRHLFQPRSLRMHVRLKPGGAAHGMHLYTLLACMLA